jgi:hypothetical protein
LNILQRIGNPRSVSMVLGMTVILSRSFAQEVQMYDLPQSSYKSSQVPVMKEKEIEIGSRYFTKKWSRGTVEMWDHRRMPEGNQILLFNYDKLTDQIYFIDQYGKQSSYPIDSVLSFDLVENSVIYSFEKIPWISSRFFLMSIYKSEKGYSLYKRLLTKYIRAGYTNAGYYSEGKKYDEYVDSYDYYLIYPGNNAFRKLNLKEGVIRRALKEESTLLDEFFTLHEKDINEQSLLGIIQYIDDKKYPE